MAAERMIFDRSCAAYAKEQIMQKSKVRKTTGKTAIYTNKHQEIQQVFGCGFAAASTGIMNKNKNFQYAALRGRCGRSAGTRLSHEE